MLKLNNELKNNIKINKTVNKILNIELEYFLLDKSIKYKNKIDIIPNKKKYFKKRKVLNSFNLIIKEEIKKTKPYIYFNQLNLEKDFDKMIKKGMNVFFNKKQNFDKKQVSFNKKTIIKKNNKIKLPQIKK